MRKSLLYTLFFMMEAGLAITLLISCIKEKPVEVFFQEDELLISAYLEEHAHEYSQLIRVLEITNLEPTLNAYGHYTFFAPDDSAFANFCTEQGKASVEDFEPDFLKTLVKYHLIDIELESSYFKNGVIQDTTYSGDHLVFTFSEGGLKTIMVNDATITERDILVENGIIHKIDKVLNPLVNSIAEQLRKSEEYTIFSEALEISGIADSLDIIRIDLNEDMFIRSRFTLFVESDDTYIQYGISNAEDLVTKYSNTGNPRNKKDGFYQYMTYHIVPGLYYLNKIDSFNYPTLAENKLINVSLKDKIYLNWHKVIEDGQSIEKFITVVEEKSNQQAKNGVFHVIDAIMEPLEPEPVYTIIDFTDYQGISIGQTYTENEIEDIPGISTENTGIYFRNSILNDGETNIQTTSDRVGWTVEFELSPILRGKYDVYLHWASYQGNTGSVQGFWDNGRFGDVFSLVHNKRWPGVEWKYDYNTSNYMGRLLLTETAPHTIRFISLENGYGNFDYMALWPVKN